MRTAQTWIVALWALAPCSAQAPADAELALCKALVAARSPVVDAPAASAADLLAAAQRAAEHPAAALLVRELQRLLPDVDDLEQLLRGVREVAAHPKAHPLLLEAARTVEYSLLDRLARREEALALDAAAGHATEWLVVGPYGDSGEITTGVPFPPEFTFPNLGEKQPGRFREVTPRVVRRKPGRATVRLAETGTNENGCFYGLHQIEAAQATACYAVVTSRSSFDLFVNGTSRMHFERVGTRLGLEFHVPITLRAGRNQILLKTTIATLTEVGLRFVDGTGRRVTGLSECPAKEGPKPWAAAKDEVLPGPFRGAKDALASTLGQTKGEARTWLALGTALAAQAEGSTSEALALALALEAEPPTEAVQRLCLAQLFLELDSLPQEVRRDRARKLAEPALKAKDLGAHATQLAVTFLEDEDKREDAIRLLEARVAAKTAGPAAFGKLLALYRGLHFGAEEDRALAAWLEAAPRSRRARLEAAQRKLTLADERGALALVRAALAEAPGEDRTLGQLARLAAQQGHEAEALAAHDRLHADERGEPAELLERRELYVRLGKSADALLLSEQVAQHAESSAVQLARVAEELALADRDEAARAALLRCLARDPSQHAARRTLAKLTGSDPLPEFAAYRRDGDSLIREFRAGDREKSASTTLVLDQMLVRVYEDGSSLEEVHQIKRINDVRGGEGSQNAERPARADEVVAIRTIAKDGKSYVPNRVEDSFSMPRLEPGSFIEEIYRNTKNSARPFPSRPATFYFQSQEEPYVLSELVVILPKGAPGTFRIRNFRGVRETKELGDGLVAHVFRAVDVPRLPTEKHHPDVESLVPVVAYGEDGDAAATARTMYASLLSQTTPSPVVTSAARELCKDLEGDLAKARAIHTMVHDAVPDAGGPADPTSVLLLKKGPRFFLEVALLKEAGVPFEIAACADRRKELTPTSAPLWIGESDLEVPAVRVLPRDAAPFWLFADTPRHAPLGFVADDRDGAAASLLREAEVRRAHVHAAEPAPGGMESRGEITLDRQGLAKLTIEITLHGTEGLGAAEQVRNLEETVQQMAGRQIAGELLKGWSLKEIDLSAVKEKGAPLRARATLTKRGAVRTTGEAALLATPIPPFGFLKVLGDRLPRELPYEWGQPIRSVWEIDVDPGESWRFLALPDAVQRRHPLLEYDLCWTRVGDKVRVRRTIQVSPGRLEAAHFSEWVDLLRSLDLVEERNLKLAPRTTGDR